LAFLAVITAVGVWRAATPPVTSDSSPTAVLLEAANEHAEPSALRAETVMRELLLLGGEFSLLVLLGCFLLLFAVWRLRARWFSGGAVPESPHRLLPVIGCMAVGFCLSATAYRIVDEREQREMDDAWSRRAGTVVSVMTAAIEARVDSVSFLRDFLTSSECVTPIEFRRFVGETMRRHPEIRCYGWAPSGRRSTEGCEAYPTVQAAEDAYIVRLVEPQAFSVPLLGLDLATLPDLRSHFERWKRDSSIAVIPSFLPDGRGEPHTDVFIVAPVFSASDPATANEPRAAPEGFVIAQLCVEEVCKRVLTTQHGMACDLRLFDPSSTSREGVLVSAFGEPATAIDAGAARLNFSLDVAGAQWRLAISPTPEYFIASTRWLPLAVFAAGVFLTVVLSGYLAVVLRRTSDLRENNMAMVDALERERATSTALEATMIQLETAMREAQTATKTKSEFLANMSHEIRTPMTAIVGFTEILASACEANCGGGEQPCMDHLQTIRRNADYLLAIINDILDISKIEAEKLEVERTHCCLVALIAEVQALMKVKADAKGLALETHFEGRIPETIQTDPKRLKQILINLLGNALKFTELGCVRLMIRYTDDKTGAPMGDRGPWIRFDVIDSGIGMTPEQIGRLFQPFTQADSTMTRRFGGTGLGLTISKRLANILGGDISVSSKPDQGSTFSAWVATGDLTDVGWFQNFCFRPSVTPSDTAAEVAVKPLLGCRVLLAEDGPDNQRLVRYVLEKAGATVALAENGEAAVQRVVSEGDQCSGETDDGFDVILMDMQMPVMDGYQATKQLRQKGYAGPIIALTAHAMSTDRSRCIEAGCDDYETKPVDRKRLVATIARNIVKRRKAAASIRRNR
jgi:signal transduction histidine kinase/AmiR/NasT family two-component response regulator